MYRNILKIITVFFVMLALIVPVTLEKLPAINEKYDMAKALEDNVLQNYVKASSDAKQEKNPDEILQEKAGFEDDLRIELPDDSEGERQSISVETDALTQTVYVKLKADVDNYFTKYSMTGRSNHIDSMQYYRKGADGVIAITTDKLYQVKQRIENGYLYLSFVNLHDIYDKVIIIDAGHGGRMTGAVRNGIEEKSINLDIVLALKEQLDSYSGDKRLGIFYTRTTDTNPTLQQRAALANKADADLFISVHCNSYEKGNFTAVSGTQVLYSQSDNRELGSKHLAQICMDNVTAATGNRAFGLLPADDIYIIRTSEAPVALVEVGFMTNRQELDNLANADYQKQAAQGIYNAIMQAFEKEGRKYIMTKIIFATGNKDKLREIKEILSDCDVDIRSMKEAGINVDIVEDGKTFEDNALIKARAIAAHTDAIVLADDSGLEIDYLNKEPGVYSARYMGEDTSYDIKNNNLIERLDGVPKEKRTARFVCAIAAVLPDGKELVTRQTMEGYIGWEIAGANGFGYDPIFYLDEYGCSSAELTPQQKNAISHRGKALRAMREMLVKVI